MEHAGLGQELLEPVDERALKALSFWCHSELSSTRGRWALSSGMLVRDWQASQPVAPGAASRALAGCRNPRCPIRCATRCRPSGARRRGSTAVFRVLDFETLRLRAPRVAAVAESLIDLRGSVRKGVQGMRRLFVGDGQPTDDFVPTRRIAFPEAAMFIWDRFALAIYGKGMSKIWT
ncbi:hypothetical protein T492DRAFT_1012529 [Pavlovales sp. CCMP2436]|nr:hypothetical protein T492DRAFT_1012529 [Pavlovales sp. CCMP2436]